jgi:hypothetical protein
MRTQAPSASRPEGRDRNARADIDGLRAAAARVDDLLAEAKAALADLMTSPAHGERTAVEPHAATDEAASVAMVADLLLDDPVQTSATNQFATLEPAGITDEPTAEPTDHDAGSSAPAPEQAEPMSTDHAPALAVDHNHEAAPADPRADGRGVFALALVSLTVMVTAAVFGQHYVGIGIVGGANLLAWLVVVQHRRTPAPAA